MKPYIKDIRLGLFVLLALGASIISSHGAYQFFLYLVDPWLAGVFILVVALGIIGLDVAGTIEHGRRAVAYYAGMAFFLVLETLANYFAGQAGFVAKIVEKLPQSSDLRAVAETQPGWTRVLVVLFLSLASLAVAFFAFAATTRFQQVRAGVEGSIVARLLGLLRQRRALIKTIVRALKSEKHERIKAGELLRHSASEATQLRTEAATLRKEVQEVRSAGAVISEQYATQENTIQELRRDLRIEADQVRAQKELAEQLKKDLRDKSAQLEEMSATLALDVRSIAQRLRDDGVPLRTIGAACGVSEKTVRNWTQEKVEA